MINLNMLLLTYSNHKHITLYIYPDTGAFDHFDETVILFDNHKAFLLDKDKNVITEINSDKFELKSHNRLVFFHQYNKKFTDIKNYDLDETYILD